LKAQFLESISQISLDDWQRLNTSTCPFLHYEFFKALEQSTSASLKKGWQPHHLLLSHDENNDIKSNNVEKNALKNHNLGNHSLENHKVEAIMPMYLKSHSWGEYVFDWDWAEAYQKNNLSYYPKLVATLPFTPVTSEKLLSNKFQTFDFFDVLSEHCQHQSINSWHMLFCPQVASEQLPENVYQRHTVQFQWFNKNYQSFDQYLDTFVARKRKNTKKERHSITQQGINVRQILGRNITAVELEFFYLTYQLTYLKRGHTPHLTLAFFQQIIITMADNILLVIANHQEKDVACALFFYDNKQLYGRYWGCTEPFNNLHFELCYYQGIEFCIANGLQSFHSGTQGEHKIQRGFEPILTYSYHWIKHPAFKAAIKNFCQQEQQHMLAYQQQCQLALPFRTSNE
jgi:predicted N-acyltransferase